MCVACEDSITKYGNAEARVSQGAAFLDKEEPNWATLVNKETLDIASSEDCVLGQLCGSYVLGVVKFFTRNSSETILMGFDGGAWIMEDLRLAWIQEIDKRLNPVNPAPEVPTKSDHILVA